MIGSQEYSAHYGKNPMFVEPSLIPGLLVMVQLMLFGLKI
jgi:hypothetical protein